MSGEDLAIVIIGVVGLLVMGAFLLVGPSGVHLIDPPDYPRPDPPPPPPVFASWTYRVEKPRRRRKSK